MIVVNKYNNKKYYVSGYNAYFFDSINTYEIIQGKVILCKEVMSND